jgi:hypothetical protein
MVVTTWPLARLAAAPYNGIGAVGCIRIIPYRTSDDRPRTRFNPGPEGDEVFISLILNNYNMDNNYKPNNYSVNSNSYIKIIE